MKKFFVITVLALAGILLHTVGAYAQKAPSPYDEQLAEEDKVEALKLFREAKALAEQGRCNEALHKLDDSLKRYKSPVTLYDKAICLYTLRRYLAAKAMAAESRELAFQQRKVALSEHENKRADALKERAESADALARKAASQLGRLTIVVPSAALTQGLVIHYQQLAAAGTDQPPALVVPEGRYNRAMEVDPGHYRVTASASGKDSWTAEVHLLGKASQISLTLPALVNAVVLNDAEQPGPSVLRMVGATLGVVGIAAIVTGAAIGASAAKSDELDTAAVRDKSAAGLVAVGAGAALASLGGIMWLIDTEPAEEGARVGVNVSPTSAKLLVQF